MHKRNSSSTRLLTGFIGISPLRLHYGRAANYGSIIIPCAYHRHHRKQSGFRCISFIARFQMEGHGALTSRLRVSPDTSNVLDECLFNFQGSRLVYRTSHYTTDKKHRFFRPPPQKNWETSKKDISQVNSYIIKATKKDGHQSQIRSMSV